MDTVKILNPLQKLQTFGQSVWFDYVRRDLFTSGELARLIKEDGLVGMTSNPAIFEKAIAGSADYDAALKTLVTKTSDCKTLYEQLAIADIQSAADLLKDVFIETKGRDGYVSLEVSPKLANDTNASIEEARRLWKLVNRPNIMIKIPGTKAGLPAIEKLISEGININVTLLFALPVYEQVAEAFIKGLEIYSSQGGDISKVASVASFFVSRIDAVIDNLISERLKTASDNQQINLLKSLQGKVAIANAKLTYQVYKRIYNSERWQKLAKNGAQTQRLLWASTGTKNPNYSDVLYVDELIGPETVNTMPPATFDAYRNHGKPSATLEQEIDKAQKIMDDLKLANISLTDICTKLVDDGVKLFIDAFDKLIDALKKKYERFSPVHLDTISYHLDKKSTEELHTQLLAWQSKNNTAKLWSHDASLWTNSDESKWLGWLNIVADQLTNIAQLKSLAESVKQSNYRHALLIGMGGSSLGPEVLSEIIGNADGYPNLLILDSTDPAQIKTIESKIDIEKTLFIVASKSGSTLEPNVLKDYFFEKVKSKKGASEAGKSFIAITDPSSKFEQNAQTLGFKAIYHGLPSIGGRYSVLSNFGMIPAAVLGMDLTTFLNRTTIMLNTCAAAVPAENNPGVLLGIIMGILARHGKDKLTLVTSSEISSLADWLEQLIAESTGKSGKGIIPVVGEALFSIKNYSKDRLFVYITLEGTVDPKQDKAMEEIQDAGHPIVRIHFSSKEDIGQEFFRWEIATATAGALIDINPFNQPDVEASKIATIKLTNDYEKNGKFPPETAFFEADGIKLFADSNNQNAIKEKLGVGKTIIDFLRAHFDRIKEGDYLALLAYLEKNEKHTMLLAQIRQRIGESKQIATCLGFGPRFLHSTGQVYKGGPNSGLFLQITHDDAIDIPIPGKKYSFGVVKAAQANGDLQVLNERKRRTLRVHLSSDVTGQLNKLNTLIHEALK